jgi:hypothetical protein
MRPQTRLLVSSLVLGSFAAVIAISGCGGGTSGTGSTGTEGTSAGGAASSGTVGMGGAGGNSTGIGGASTGTTGTAGTAGTASTGASMTTTTGSGVGTIVTCQGKTYQCGDLIDNDNDGKLDSEDPDCLGPCDNTEDGYISGIPGGSGPDCTVDCYFDQDSGAGNDDCHWSHQCDPHEVAPNYYPESSAGDKCKYDMAASIPGSTMTCDQLYNAQSTTCTSFCGPLTPNGCDCFGCCELPAGKGNYVWLGSENADGSGSCSLSVVDDPMKCQPCLPVKACLNTCGKCELCIGKTTLPPECNPSSSTSSSASSGASGSTGSGATTGSGGGEQCETGVQPCGLPGQDVCTGGAYCITGCCQKIPT